MRWERNPPCLIIQWLDNAVVSMFLFFGIFQFFVFELVLFRVRLPYSLHLILATQTCYYCFYNENDCFDNYRSVAKNNTKE